MSSATRSEGLNSRKETNIPIPAKFFPNTLAQYWPDFVECEKRLVKLASFLVSLCGHPAKNRVLDAATGIGCESIFLLSKGYKVVSNEIDYELSVLARSNAEKAGLNIDLRAVDWLEFREEYDPNSFDVILVSGNSLCLLLEAPNRMKSVKEFYRVLNQGGRLIIDERNFRYILREKESILRGNFKYSGKYLYCGSKVTGKPIDINDNRVTFEYYHYRRGPVGKLEMYPFKQGELKQMLLEAGFHHVWSVADLGESEESNCDFITYIATK